MLLWASTCLAQTELAPKEEYRVLASTNSVTIAKGQQDSIKISIIRSKSFKSGKASLSTSPPSCSGVTMSMKQHPERPDEFIVYLSASSDAKAGEYSFVPTCSLRNENKGIVLKLIIL